MEETANRVECSQRLAPTARINAKFPSNLSPASPCSAVTVSRNRKISAEATAVISEDLSAATVTLVEATVTTTATIVPSATTATSETTAITVIPAKNVVNVNTAITATTAAPLLKYAEASVELATAVATTAPFPSNQNLDARFSAPNVLARA